jgi:hypothetical protein
MDNRMTRPCSNARAAAFDRDSRGLARAIVVGVARAPQRRRQSAVTAERRDRRRETNVRIHRGPSVLA